MNDNSKNRGRPKKAEEQAKNESMLVRLTAEEKQQFEMAAEATNLTLSEWVRGTLWAAAAPANRGIKPENLTHGKLVAATKPPRKITTHDELQDQLRESLVKKGIHEASKLLVLPATDDPQASRDVTLPLSLKMAVSMPLPILEEILAIKYQKTDDVIRLLLTRGRICQPLEVQSET